MSSDSYGTLLVSRSACARWWSQPQVRVPSCNSVEFVFHSLPLRWSLEACRMQVEKRDPHVNEVEKEGVLHNGLLLWIINRNIGKMQLVINR